MNPRLRDGEVHVWCADLECPALLVRSLSLLTDDERERAERVRFPRDAAHFATSRAVLRTILGRYLDVEPGDLRFSYGANGKPALAQPFENALKFNLSRSKGVALYAIASDAEVGIDVEWVGADLEVDQLAERFFSPAESTCIRRLSAGEKRTAFLKYWVSKEAYVKATGDGLSLPLNSFEVSFTGKPLLIGTEASGQPSTKWSLKPLSGLGGHIAALVGDENCTHVRHFF